MIEPCRWIHTIGMRFPIDVAYLDDDGVVVKTIQMHRHRVGHPGRPRPDRSIEAEAGAFARWGLRVGDVVEVRVTTRRPPLADEHRSGWSPHRSATWATWRRAPSTRCATRRSICCEDTRRTGRLLQHAGIKAQRLAVCNDHTELARIGDVLDVLGRRRRCGDRQRRRHARHLRPGRADRAGRDRRRLHRRARSPDRARRSWRSPSAGCRPTGSCSRGSCRARAATVPPGSPRLAAETRTTVIYEAPHRALRTLDDLREACGDDRMIVVTRELTKLYETVVRGPLGDDRHRRRPRRVRGRARRRARRRPSPVDDETIRDALRVEFAAGASTRDASAAVALAPRRRQARRLRPGRRARRRPLRSSRTRPRRRTERADE